jgi:hypothetical protein
MTLSPHLDDDEPLRALLLCCITPYQGPHHRLLGKGLLCGGLKFLQTLPLALVCTPSSQQLHDRQDDASACNIALWFSFLSSTANPVALQNSSVHQSQKSLYSILGKSVTVHSYKISEI